MDLQLVFKTNNILFYKVSIELIDEYLELVNDKTIQRSTLTKEKEYSKEKELAWIQNVLDNNELVFSMLDKNTNEFIGNITLDDINDEVAEIALSIKSILQNRGYGKEAIKGLIDYAKEVLHYKSLIAVIFSNNDRSLHCFQKLGFKEYEREEAVKKENGQSIDDIYLKLEFWVLKIKLYPKMKESIV